MKVVKLKDSKYIIRERILEARSRMSGEEICAKSAAIQARLLEMQSFGPAGLILCYMDFRSEVKTGGFIRECLRRGKRIALPLAGNSSDGHRKLTAYEIRDPDNDVLPGSYSIYEPVPERTRKVSEEEIDLVIVPGVAFDIHKNRVGYGAGYYDRFLGKLKQGCTRVGIAFDLQIADKVPAEVYDIPMDIIVTESRIIL